MFRSFKFYVGQSIDIGPFCRSLSDLGYTHQGRVQEEGDFARRGGIVDVYPVTFELPVRVAWDATTIQSVKSFSLETGQGLWEHTIVIVLPRSRTQSHVPAGSPGVAPLANFVDIQKGDLVVHQQYGIGRFQGIEKIAGAGGERDHMVIRYAGEDKLFVPVDQMHLVQKYVSFGGRKPGLHRLGEGEWRRIRMRAQRATIRVALDLLKLQAMRKTLGGFGFSPDKPWQKEFEATFPFKETADQDEAVRATKKDMEGAYAMDRLLCGDVGYGKTEVAMRAAFKCVMDAKQVAFLVPTTVLAEQHTQNFVRRLKDFPVRVEMLSRFKSAAQQKTIIADLARGAVDIVIGTHRLLSADIAFKDLGLVIIDEEQRFGVKSKERLKEMRSLVDVLTLTATPIPRTLYMSLMGAKDISTINTPPERRSAVATHVVARDDALLGQALARELKRRGQIFFVHNRIEDIAEVAAQVRRLVPSGTRVVAAHGRMPSRMLERVMVDFLNGAIDVLVSTTIIESGIDVPNANTIIINNADCFGLADLHQMRGRVGRFTRKAYAYFVVDERKPLTPESRKRLEAIYAYSQLGAGFKIAMEDLEIRGAGNLLGVQQHGHIAQVGFDMYCRLLREAVTALKHNFPSGA
ncbi:MAG: transcription-repair coupling factor [Deltaproteobacteria bacterium]